MKNIFRKDPMNQLETTIAALTKRAAQLDAQRSTAQAALDKATKARQGALLGADEIDEQSIAKLQRAVSDAASLLQGIDDATGILTQEKAQVEAQLAAELERIERAAAAEKLAAQVATIEAALPKYLEQSRALAEALAQVGHFHFESNQMANFVQNAMGQIEIAANFTLVELKTMPDAIREGRQAIPREEPDPGPVAVIEPTPPMQTVFLLKSVKFRDHAGKMRHGLQYEDCELPMQLAHRALRCNAAVGLSDPRRRKLKGARGGAHANPNAIDIIDLDDEQATRPPHIDPITASDPVLRAANFTPLDRSAESRVLSIAGPRF